MCVNKHNKIHKITNIKRDILSHTIMFAYNFIKHFKMNNEIISKHELSYVKIHLHRNHSQIHNLIIILYTNTF